MGSQHAWGEGILLIQHLIHNSEECDWGKMITPWVLFIQAVIDPGHPGSHYSQSPGRH